MLIFLPPLSVPFTYAKKYSISKFYSQYFLKFAFKKKSSEKVTVEWRKKCDSGGKKNFYDRSTLKKQVILNSKNVEAKTLSEHTHSDQFLGIPTHNDCHLDPWYGANHNLHRIR